NKQLLNLLHEQQKYINKLIENQNENIEQEKHLMSPESQNKDYFNRIMTEHKVKYKLEKEALTLWNSKPEKERMKSVGWFRVKEVIEVIEIFISIYINVKCELN